jgi:hypothetical protein
MFKTKIHYKTSAHYGHLKNIDLPYPLSVSNTNEFTPTNEKVAPAYMCVDYVHFTFVRVVAYFIRPSEQYYSNIRLCYLVGVRRRTGLVTGCSKDEFMECSGSPTFRNTCSIYDFPYT